MSLTNTKIVMISHFARVDHVVEEAREEVKRDIWRVGRSADVVLLLLVPDKSKVHNLPGLGRVEKTHSGWRSSSAAMTAAL